MVEVFILFFFSLLPFFFIFTRYHSFVDANPTQDQDLILPNDANNAIGIQPIDVFYIEEYMTIQKFCEPLSVRV